MTKDASGEADPPMIHSVKDLSPDQRLAIESLLGHAISQREKISVRAASEFSSADLLKAAQIDVKVMGPERIPESLWSYALQTFGAASPASEWFRTECGALNNRAPLDLMSDDAGIQEIDRILGCIDYGMIA